jgi:hypothetical protein
LHVSDPIIQDPSVKNVIALSVALILPELKDPYQFIVRGIDSLLMGTSVTMGGRQKLPKIFKKHTDMTIHSKPVEKHFLMVLAFSIHPISGENCIS